MPSIETWKAQDITIVPNEAFTFNLENKDANIFFIENRQAVNGGAVFLDTRSSVSESSHILKAEQGKSQMLVRPHGLSTVYLTTNSASPVRVTVYEIKSDQIRFNFTSAQVMDIQGKVQVDEPVSIDGTVGITGDVEIKNDSGNPIPVSGTVGVNALPALPAGTNNIGDVDVLTLPALPAGTNNIGDVDVLTLPKVEKSGYSYLEVVAAAAGDITVKAAAGEVVSLTSDGTAKVRLKDGTNNVWKQITGETHFPEPVTHGTSIILNFDVAGTAYIIYK